MNGNDDSRKVSTKKKKNRLKDRGDNIVNG